MKKVIISIMYVLVYSLSAAQTTPQETKKKAIQCAAITKAGSRCKKMVNPSKGAYCWMHAGKEANNVQ